MSGALSIPPGRAAAGGAYAEHAPPAALAPHVECFWSRSSAGIATAATLAHRVIPDGCADIVLAFSVPAQPRLGSGAAPDVALAVGAMTRALLFRDAADVSYLGVRFRPGVAGTLFGVPASELTDIRVPLGEVWPESEMLRDALARAPDTSARMRTLSAAVARRLLAAGDAPPRVVLAATERIVGARGALPIGRLAADLGVTRQSLARSFARHVGLSPKLLARIVRARHVVDRVRGRGDVEWSTLALEAGYYDQSHLIGDLKELTGLAPSAWAASRRA